MQIRRNAVYYVIALLSISSLLWGCPKKTEVTATPEAQQQTKPGAAEEKNRETAATNPEQKSEAAEQQASNAPGLQPIYFDYNESSVRADARQVMASNAQWLKANPKAKIAIEGNCDERGTTEYNQALGQRRAAAAKKYLMTMGIPGKRISLISYGKEKPVCRESNDECWQRNRRDDLAVQKQ